MRQNLPVDLGTCCEYLRSRYMADDNDEQARLRRAALQGIVSRLKRDIQPDKDAPDRVRELIDQIEATGTPKNKE